MHFLHQISRLMAPWTFASTPREQNLAVANRSWLETWRVGNYVSEERLLRPNYHIEIYQ
jgi:hypothetical protein